MKKGIGIIALVLVSIFAFTGCTRTYRKPDKLEPTQIENVNNIGGVTMTIKEGSVSPTTIGLIIENNSCREFRYVPLTSLEINIDDKWYEVPEINVIYYDMAQEFLESGKKAEIEADWEDLYGSLGKGKYRSIVYLEEYFRGSSEPDLYCLAAEFELD